MCFFTWGERAAHLKHLCEAECRDVRKDLGLRGSTQGPFWPCPLLLSATCRAPRTPREGAERAGTSVGHTGAHWAPGPFSA